MSTGVFVVNNTGQAGEPTCKTILGYRSVLDSSFVAGTGSAHQDTLHPLSNAFDYSYVTEYSINTSLAPSFALLEFNLTSSQNINYFTLISKNAESCGLNYTVDIRKEGDSAYTVAGSSGDVKNGVPSMIYWGDLYDDGGSNTISVRINLFYTSKPYIMSMMCGEAIVFPRTMSLGFQPAATASLDEVRAFNADEGLNIVTSRRLVRGYQARGSINYVRMKTARQFWPEYMEHVLDSKPICLMWNDAMPEDVIYGVQNPDRLTKLTYKTSLFTQIDFDIIGWA